MKEHAQQMMFGEAHSGLGIFGNGTYTAYGTKAQGIAEAYTADGTITRMALKPNARIISYHNAQKLSNLEYGKLNQQVVSMYEKYNDMRRSLAPGRAARAELESMKELIDRTEAMREAVTDVGRWASMAGYDAINVVERSYMVVLNRTAMYMEAL